jgi:hypothetical protein
MVSALRLKSKMDGLPSARTHAQANRQGAGLTSYMRLWAKAAIGARLGCSAIIPLNVVEVLYAIEPRRQLLVAHADEGEGIPSPVGTIGVNSLYRKGSGKA